jgi:hypothetical protein
VKNNTYKRELHGKILRSKIKNRKLSMIINVRDKLISFGATVGRLLISSMFFMSGISKINSYQNMAAWMES